MRLDGRPVTTIYYALVVLFAGAWLVLGARITWWLVAHREGFFEKVEEIWEYLT